MKLIKKMGVIMLSIFVLTAMVPSMAFAASGSVRVSSASGNVGSTVTISCTASISGASIGSADVTLTYNPAALTLVSCSSGAGGGAGGIYASLFASSAGQSSLSFSMTFKILTEGTHAISVSSAEVSDWDTAQAVGTSAGGGSITGKAVTTSTPSTGNSGSSGSGNTGTGNTSSSGSGNTGTGNTGSSSSGNTGTGNTSSSGSGNTGTGNTGSSSTGNTGTGNSGSSSTGNTEENGDTKQEEKKDTNSKLKSLRAYPGTLSPSFQEGKTSYTVKVAEDVTEVTITATAQSDKAKVSVSGGKNLEFGENAAKVVVTSESGAVTVYNISIMRESAAKIKIGDVEYTVNEKFKDEEIPEGFVKEKLTIDGKEVEALSHDKGDLKLLNLKDENGSAFYIWDQKNNTKHPFVQINITENKKVTVLPIYENKEFGSVTKLTFGETKVEAWKIDKDFSVIPVMDQEGKEILYKYDKVDETLQRYSDSVPEKPKAAAKIPDVISAYGMYIIVGLGIVIGVLSIVVIYFLRAREKTAIKEKYIQPDNDDGE